MWFPTRSNFPFLSFSFVCSCRQGWIPDGGGSAFETNGFQLAFDANVVELSTWSCTPYRDRGGIHMHNPPLTLLPTCPEQGSLYVRAMFCWVPIPSYGMDAARDTQRSSEGNGPECWWVNPLYFCLRTREREPLWRYHTILHRTDVGCKHCY